MNSKIKSIVIPSILAFALIAGIIPATFAQNNTDMTSEGGNMTGMTPDGNMAQGGNMTGMTQGQTDDDGDMVMVMTVMTAAKTMETVKKIKIKENRI